MKSRILARVCGPPVMATAMLAALASTSAMAAGGPPPCAPAANIAPANQVVNEGALVTMNGTPSKDETSYAWSQTAGPLVTLSSTTAAMPSFTAPSVGPAGATLKFTLRVTGCSPTPITSAPEETTITVLDIPDPNRPPVASATVSPASIYTGYTVTLDGSGSNDPDGDALTYSWEQISGTTVTLSGANTAMATLTAPSAPYPDGATLKFKLTVSDGSLQASTEQIVNVLWQNAAPTASVSCPASVIEGAEFTLDGSASSDPDDGIAAYSWSQTLGGPVANLPLDTTTASITATAPLLGSSLVTMSFKLEVTDRGGLMDDAECDVEVIDITPPEADPTQSPARNVYGWNNSDVTVTWDWIDFGVGIDDANCTESSTSSGEGSELELTATCSDLSGNEGSSSYRVNVDKTKPTISAAATTSPNGNGWYKADVTVDFTCEDGLSGLDGACPASQSLTTEGAAVSSTSQTVWDKAGNASDPSNVVTVKIDKTKPTISAAATTSPNGNGWYKDDVTVDFTCTDSLSGIAAGACPGDEVLSTEGATVSSTSQTVSDNAGNVSVPSNVVTVSIDKTGPGINWTGGINDGDSFYFGSVPAAPTCSATDALSGPDGCAVSGYSALVGSHTLTATARDKAGNETKETRQYTVLAWTLRGFYQPVDMGTVVNTVKGGSTVPLKFEVFAANELTDVGVVKTFMQQKVACGGTALEDPIEVVSTGGTSLRYDSTAGQFIQNWQTPKLPGVCYIVTMTTDDGSSLTANFKLK